MVTARCSCCGDDPWLVPYHDDDWGRPVANDDRLFEKLCLEGFQAGLSWLTILRKREAFRAAFGAFDPEVVAAFEPGDVERLMDDAGIVRNRAKIESTINDARRAIELPSLAAHVGSFAPPPDRPAPVTRAATSPESVALSRDLKKRGLELRGADHQGAARTCALPLSTRARAAGAASVPTMVIGTTGRSTTEPMRGPSSWY